MNREPGYFQAVIYIELLVEASCLTPMKFIDLLSNDVDMALPSFTPTFDTIIHLPPLLDTDLSLEIET